MKELTAILRICSAYEVLRHAAGSMYGIHTRQQKNIFIFVQVYLSPRCSNSSGAQSDRDDATFGLQTTEFLRSRFKHRPGSGCNKATATSPMDDVVLVLFSLSPIAEFTFNPLWRPTLSSCR